MNRLLVLAMLSGCRHAAAPVVTEPIASPTAPAKPGRVVVSDTDIHILDPIRFEGPSAKITVTSIPMLDAVAATFQGNPNIRLVEVVAYGGDGVEQFQQVIADHRAQAIVDELVRRGVEPARLRPSGIAKAPGGVSNVPVFVILERR